MRANRLSACVLAALIGCTGTGDVQYAGEVHVTSPELISVSPGVSVLADADEPLFYSNGYYWLYRDGIWLRSSSYRGGFARIEHAYVPERIRAIDRPQFYVQYRRYSADTRQARADQVPTRSQRPYEPRGPVSPYPPPGSGVPSTPPPETWQPGQPHHPRNSPGGINPLAPQPTPPVTSPNDTHGTPMPPGPGGSIIDDHNQARGPQSGRGAVVPPGEDSVSIPDRPQPGQQAKAGAPTRPEERAALMRPDDRGPREAGDQGHRARPEDRSARRQPPHGTQPARDSNDAPQTSRRDKKADNRVDQNAQDRVDQGTPPSAATRAPAPPEVAKRGRRAF
jgi:hypothetical protein